MTEEKRKEDLKNLEKLHRDALERKVADYHRATKTTIKSFQEVHLKFRDSYPAYKLWHNFRFANLIHWAIFSLILASLGYYFYFSLSFIAKVSNQPTNFLVVFGKPVSGDIKAGIFKRSNIIINKKNQAEIEDKTIAVGYAEFRGYTYNLVNWKNLTWKADVPEGSSIVYRLRTTKDEIDGLEKSGWSPYYQIKGKNTSSHGIPLVKSRLLQIEIIFQGDKGSWPKLYYLNLGFTPFKENQFLVSVKDNLFSWIQNFFRFIQRKEGIYSE